jgi:hypothetical protein
VTIDSVQKEIASLEGQLADLKATLEVLKNKEATQQQESAEHADDARPAAAGHVPGTVSSMTTAAQATPPERQERGHVVALVFRVVPRAARVWHRRC